MIIKSNEAIETACLPGIEHQTLAGGDDGLKKLSVWSQTIAAGSATPPHRHDCEEVAVILEGEGEIIYKNVPQKFKAPCTLIIEPDCEHQIINSGTEPMKIFAAFTMTPVEAYLPDNRKLDLPWRS